MARKEKQTICPICNKKLPFLKSTIKDGVKVCVEHTMDAGVYAVKELNQSTTEEIKEKIEQRRIAREEAVRKVSDFGATKVISPLYFNDVDKKILIRDNISDNIIDYKDIISFDVIEDGESTITGGIGRALVGGVLFGGAGAVVGAVTASKKKKYCNNLQVKITINNISKPHLYVPFINKKTETDSIEYKSSHNVAQELVSTLQVICDSQKDINNEGAVHPINQVKQFKELLDEGIISQEEFERKKKELLGL